MKEVIYLFSPLLPGQEEPILANCFGHCGRVHIGTYGQILNSWWYGCSRHDCPVVELQTGPCESEFGFGVVYTILRRLRESPK